MVQPGQPLQQPVSIRQAGLADPEIQQAVGQQRQHQQQQTEQPQQPLGAEPATRRAEVQRIRTFGAGGHAAQAAGALQAAHRDELMHLDAGRTGPAALVAVVASTSQAARRIPANAQRCQQAE
ncbi:hypothetical protein D3C76_1152680 [compost metagenome]